MKKKLSAIILAIMCFSAASCGGAAEQTTTTTAQAEAQPAAVTFTASQVTEAVLTEITINSAIEKDKDSLAAYFPDMDTAGLTDVSYYMCASGAYPDEIGVFVFESAQLAETAKASVESRLEKQKATYESYTPEEMYKLEDAVVEVRNNIIIYSVTADNSRANEIMTGFIG